MSLRSHPGFLKVAFRAVVNAAAALSGKVCSRLSPVPHEAPPEPPGMWAMNTGGFRGLGLLRASSPCSCTGPLGQGTV